MPGAHEFKKKLFAKQQQQEFLRSETLRKARIPRNRRSIFPLLCQTAFLRSQEVLVEVFVVFSVQWIGDFLVEFLKRQKKQRQKPCVSKPNVENLKRIRDVET